MWTVDITGHGDGVWSVYGTSGSDRTADHQGTNVVGTEKDARGAAKEIFGDDAKITVHRGRRRRR